MKKLIMVSSITYALKGRDLLRSKGFKAYIERTPSMFDRVGCGYSVYVNGDLDRALELFRENGIRVYGVTESAKN